MKTIFHIPHSSTYIPDEYKQDFLLSPSELEKEAILMADSKLNELVDINDAIIFPYSRLLCDVERFDSESEEMNSVGMGVLYTKTHDLKPLRNNPSPEIKKLYYSHHKKLNDTISRELKTNDSILFIDLHSYSKKSLKYELYKNKKRPQICIGLNDGYDKKILEKLIYIIKEFGYTYSINEPFSGCLTPSNYKNDKRVNCVMIEIRKDVYKSSDGFEKTKRFLETIKNGFTTKKFIKTYEQYLSDKLLSDEFDETTLTSVEMNDILKDKYEKMYFDYLLMKDVVDIRYTKNEAVNNRSDVVISIIKDDFINDPEEFYKSYSVSKRVAYMTPYTVEELSEFSLFKLKGYNVGFAIKPNGEIILVHNNERIRGIGDLLIKKAIEHGGDQLDHFDGGLTGFYKKNGFKFRSSDEFVLEYAPKDWKYERVEIDNPEKSIYAEEKKVSRSEFIDAKIRYENGKPDVVYRKIKAD